MPQGGVIAALQPALRTVGSVRFACALLIFAMVAMACATVYESVHGAEQAMAAFYGSSWFALLLALLGANVLASALLRFPFSRRHIGFLLTHGSILLVLVGALVTRRWGVDGQVTLLEGQTADEFGVRQGVLVLTRRADGAEAEVDVPRTLARRFKVVEDPAGPVLEFEGIEARLRRYLPDSKETRRVVNDSPLARSAIQVRLDHAGHGEHDPVWVFANQAARVGPRTIAFRTAADPAELGQLLAPIEIVEAPGSDLFVRFSTPEGRATTHRLGLGKAVESPRQGETLTLLQRLDHARIEHVVTPISPVREDRVPALLVELTRGEHTSEMWIRRYRPEPVAIDGVAYHLTYRDRQLPLGLQVTLDRFEATRYPGIDMRRAFESHVTFLDPATGRSQSRVISMNHPTTFGGYTFYQHKYSEGRAGKSSTLIVARDPGQLVVFAGYILMLVGMIWVLSTRLKTRRRASL